MRLGFAKSWRRCASFAALLLGAASEARAEEPPRDQFLLPPARGKSGTWATFDAYTAGLQAQLEKRFILRSEDYAALIPRANAIASLGFGEAAANFDARFLFFSAGVSGGFRRTWRGYSFPDGEPGTRQKRLDRDAVKDHEIIDTPFAEIRGRLALPLHENALGVFGVSHRVDSGPRNSFDWALTTMRDGGAVTRFDATLFYRSPGFGGVGPTVRVLAFERSGRRTAELAFGFVAGRRVGWLPNDLFLVNILSQPESAEFGFHILRAPLFTLLVYRIGVDL